MVACMPDDTAAVRLDNLERRTQKLEEDFRDLHERFRPVEAFTHQGWPLHLERIDQQGKKLDDLGERWQSVDREIVRIRTQLTIAAGGLVILIPIITTLIQRLFRLVP